jgi:hypothetical protein
MVPGGMRVERGGKPVLEVLALRRVDGCWALPGAFSASADVTLTNIMKKAFGMDHRMLPLSLRKEIAAMQGVLQELAEPVYRGYMDDGRNTDNAWVETHASHFHDEGGVLARLEIMDCPDQSMLSDVLVFPSSVSPTLTCPCRPRPERDLTTDTTEVAWIVAHRHQRLFVEHSHLLARVVSKMKAYW